MIYDRQRCSTNNLKPTSYGCKHILSNTLRLNYQTMIQEYMIAIQSWRYEDAHINRLDVDRLAIQEIRGTGLE